MKYVFLNLLNNNKTYDLSKSSTSLRILSKSFLGQFLCFPFLSIGMFPMVDNDSLRVCTRFTEIQCKEINAFMQLHIYSD